MHPFVFYGLRLTGDGVAWVRVVELYPELVVLRTWPSKARPAAMDA